MIPRIWGIEYLNTRHRKQKSGCQEVGGTEKGITVLIGIAFQFYKMESMAVVGDNGCTLLGIH